jgi:hypothetical protein
MSLWDTQTYTLIPYGAKRLTIDLWCCGDEYCSCRQFRIWVYVGPEHPHTPEHRRKQGKDWGWILWEGQFHSDPGVEEQKEMIEDLQLACKFYGIVPTDIEDGSIYYVKGEREL